jgi:hypothetical protein
MLFKITRPTNALRASQQLRCFANKNDTHNEHLDKALIDKY